MISFNIFSIPMHRYIRSFHCSKQCFMSSVVRPFNSSAVFVFFCTDSKQLPFPFPCFSLLEIGRSHREPNLANEEGTQQGLFISQKLLYGKGTVSWRVVLIQNPLFVLPQIWPLLFFSFTYVFEAYLIDFFDVFICFRCALATWMFVVFHFFSILTKPFMPLENSCT